jgi:hypothetical protein
MRDSRLLTVSRVLDHKQTESNEHEGFRISRYGADGVRIEDENGESIDIGSCFQNRDPSFYGSAVAYSPIVYMFENKILYRSGLLVSALNNEEIHLFDFTIYTAIFYKKNILLLNNEIVCDVSNNYFHTPYPFWKRIFPASPETTLSSCVNQDESLIAILTTSYLKIIDISDNSIIHQFDDLSILSANLVDDSTASLSSVAWWSTKELAIAFSNSLLVVTSLPLLDKSVLSPLPIQLESGNVKLASIPSAPESLFILEFDPFVDKYRYLYYSNYH